MSASGPSLRLQVGNFPLHVEKSSIQDVLMQYHPDKFEYNAMTGTAELSFRNEASLSIALQTLNGRTLFGRKLTATRFVASDAPVPTSTFAFPTVPPVFFQFPPYNDQIGVHILQYASTRQDFYNSVLMLMKSMGLPPPFAQTNSNNLANTPTGSTTQPIGEIPPGSRLKRTEPDLPSSDSSTPSDSLNGCNGPPETKKRVELDQSSSEITEQEALQIETPLQPLHLDIHKSTKRESSDKSILNIIVSAKPQENTQQQSTIEIVPFDVHAQAGARSTGPIVKNFISEAELNANKMAIEQIKSIPRFETWEPGVPSEKLFVKNLPPKILEVDLARIFGRFSRTGLGDDVSVRLMTRGKMHGQAFVTFPDSEMAEKALEQVLGFLLHDRPMILVFGKSSDHR